MRIHKQQATPVRTQIYPDIPWKVQQVQVHCHYFTVSPCSTTCFERPLKFSTKIGRKRQVALQMRGKINIKSKEFHKRLTS